MKRIAIATVLGGLMLFGWGFVSREVLDWHETSGGKLPNEKAFVSAMKDAGDGVYKVPGYEQGTNPMKDESWVKRHQDGPLALVVYHKRGKEPMSTMLMVRGLLLNLGGAFVVSIMLVRGGFRGWFGRFSFVVGIGLLAAVGDGLMWNFMGFPDDWAKVMAADHVAGWGIAGVFMAIATKPSQA
jgi:hypothetical protein